MDGTTPADPQSPAATPPAGGYVPGRRSRAGWWIAAIVAVVALLSLGSCCVALSALSGTEGSNRFPGAGGRGIALIHIDGTIQDQGANGTGADPQRLIRLLKKAEDDDGIKAVLLRINSPGGTVSASQEIAMQVARMKKPVLADIGDTGASGAYYVASQSDEIMATPSSAVGSIGVILEAPNVADLMRKVGVTVTVIFEGAHKDIGSPFRSMTPSEAAILRADIKPAYDQFVKDVAKGRKLPEAKVREMATGLVWSGEVAQKMGLVDKIGNYADAFAAAGKLGGIEGEPDVVDYDEGNVFGALGRLAGAVERLAPPSAAADALRGTQAPR